MSGGKWRPMPAGDVLCDSFVGSAVALMADSKRLALLKREEGVHSPHELLTVAVQSLLHDIAPDANVMVPVYSSQQGSHHLGSAHNTCMWDDLASWLGSLSGAVGFFSAALGGLAVPGACGGRREPRPAAKQARGRVGSTRGGPAAVFTRRSLDAELFSCFVCKHRVITVCQVTA